MNERKIDDERTLELFGAAGCDETEQMEEKSMRKCRRAFKMRRLLSTAQS